MILYFSGTGNSEYVAKRIGEKTHQEVMNLFDKIKNNDHSKMESDSPWVIVCPTYAWKIPRILEDWIKKTELSHQDIYFVMTCGGSIGNAGKYLEELCTLKHMNYFSLLLCQRIILRCFIHLQKRKHYELLIRQMRKLMKLLY